MCDGQVKEDHPIHQLLTIQLQKQFLSESIDVHFISMNKGSSFTFSYIQKGNSP